jgi:GNAT superfamily N-acetyltransferase
LNLHLRPYQYPEDYLAISRFLCSHYQPGNRDGNWLEPIWEYMHFHPALDSESLQKSGIWEDDGRIAAVAHYESNLGETFFQFHPAYRHLREQMLDYAEKNLFGWSDTQQEKLISVYINKDDTDFQTLAASRGYIKEAQNNRPMAYFEIPDPFAPISLPPGFQLISLADECDWGKVHRVMWRGFNHPGEPPAGEDELQSRQKMFDTPSARRDLKIVVKAPDGDFVAFCGMFYQPTNHFAYVEPVATDPAYRRLGLGKAAVLEGIRRCAALGANSAYVGSDQAFYQAIGFHVFMVSECWTKCLP